MATPKRLTIDEDPALVYRQLYSDLLVFASHSGEEDANHAFRDVLVAREKELCDDNKSLCFWVRSPPNTADRQTLQQTNQIELPKHKQVEVSPLIQQEIFKLSDELQLSERESIKFWLLASQQELRETVARQDAAASAGSAGGGAGGKSAASLTVNATLQPSEWRNLTLSIPQAARYFVISEMEFKLLLVKELMQLRYDQRMDLKQKRFVVQFTNRLLRNGLLNQLLKALAEDLPKLENNVHLQQQAMNWTCLVAESIQHAVFSTQLVPEEIKQIAHALRGCCKRLQQFLPKISPNIVNLLTPSELQNAANSIGAGSLETSIEQAACLLQTITALQVALISVLIQTQGPRLERQDGEISTTNALNAAEHAAIVNELHDLIVRQKWDHQGFQAVAMLAWAVFLRNSGDAASSSSYFSVAEESEEVVDKAIRLKVFSFLVDVELKFSPDPKRNRQLASLYECQYQQLFVEFSSSLLVRVPTFADKQVMIKMRDEKETSGTGEDIGVWEGDCLENLIDFAVVLCTRNPCFARKFWVDDSDQRTSKSCVPFLANCRDAAFKNPACFSVYMRLVAVAAKGPDCAQAAFNHVKQNPPLLNWNYFFMVMNKYQRLLMEAEKPHQFSSMTTSKANDRPAVPRSIRPKELEALETIQVVIQSVICDPHLALIFFHNHEWAPIPTFVSLLQCRIPSSLKGEIMKTLSIFAQVPEIAPFVWRHVEALQILRTSGEPGIGNQDIRFELEHFESMARSYPATRGFLHLLHEYFRNHSTWSIGSDGRLPTSQYYFEYLVQNVFMKFDLRKYGDEEEMWSILASTLGIFREILGNYRPSTMLGSQDESRLISQNGFGAKPQQEVESMWFANLGYQLMEKLLSSSALLDKLLLVLTLDGGVDSLENIVEDLQFERAFTFCRDYVREKTEGPLNRSSEEMSMAQLETSEASVTASGSRAAERERSVVVALEIILLVCEKDTEFVAKCRSQSASQRLQLETLHAILLRRRSDLVSIVRYIKYTKSVQVAKLSAAVFGLLSGRVAGEEMLYAVLDSGASTELVSGYMCWLFKADEDESNDGLWGDSSDGESGILRTPTQEPENEFDTISLVSRKRKRRSFTNLDAVEKTSSVRSLILDLLLANLAKPVPNVAHLLLGVFDSTMDTSAPQKIQDVAMSTRNATQTCLDAILILLSSIDFQLDCAELAEKCHRVVYLLLSQEFTSRRVLPMLQNPKYDYFVEQLEFLLLRMEQGGDHAQSTSFIAGLNTMGWLLKSTALYMHLGLAWKDMELLKRISMLATSLVSVEQNGNAFILLRLLDDLSFDFGPPEVPNDKTAISIAEKLTSVVDVGVFSWLKIDVEAFYQALQSGTNGDGFMSKRDREMEASSESSHELLLTWAIQWNCFSERVAALSHALNSWRQVVEVLVLRFFSLTPEEEENDPQLASIVPLLPAVEQRYEVAFLVLEAVLTKIVHSSANSAVSAQLVEIVATLCHALFAWLRDWNVDVKSEARRVPALRLLELLFAAISTSSAAFGNPTASRNSRTLLYSCLVNFCFSSRDATSAMDGTLMNSSIGGSMRQTHKFASLLSGQRRSSLVNERCVEVICRDASDACDSLSMALAISALEALVAFDNETVVRMMRDQGFLLHLMSVFRKIASSSDIVETNAMQSGIANAGTLHERLLSFFAVVALNSNGALALVENGLLAQIVNGAHVPSHRPRLVMAKQNNSLSQETQIKSEGAFYGRWLPVLRLLSALCASLPQNGMLATKLLELIAVHRRLFSSALKEVAAHQGMLPSLSLMHELTYTTSLFRYVGQFPELCDKMLTPGKMVKFAHWLVQVAFVYGAQVVPSLENENKEAVSKMNGQDSNSWWTEVVARTTCELRNDAISRLCVLDSGNLSNFSAGDNGSSVEVTLKALTSLSVFGEEKLYASRMILCNALAFCSRRLMGVVDPTQTVVPLFAMPGFSWNQMSSNLPSFASSQQSQPASTLALASQSMALPSSPPLESVVALLDSLVQEFQVARGCLQQFETIVQENDMESSEQPNGDSQEAFNATRSVLEYHLDSLTFTVETLMMVMTEHVLLYDRMDKTRAHTVQLVEDIVSVVDVIEDLPFVHALARKLREVELRSS